MKNSRGYRKLRKVSVVCAALLSAGLLACPAAAAERGTALAEVLVLRRNGENAAAVSNPWSETEDLTEACEGAGIDFSEPVEMAIPDGLTRRPYRYMEDMIETSYEGENDELTIRVSTGREGVDLSGDYNEYSHEWDENFKGLLAHCSGDGEMINAALFDGPGAHFAVLYNTGEEGRGLTADQLKSLVMCMQAMPLS